jgi:hypothetical protein
MKKIILSAMAICAFSFANAQDKKDMSFGIKGGMNISAVTNVTGSSSLTGFHIGGFAEFKVSDKLTIQPELLYSTQGDKYDGGKTNLDYINIPVMAKYYVTDALSLEAGPQIGLLISGKENLDSGGSTDVKSAYKSTDFDLDLGAGYDFTENFSAAVRYNIGLAHLQKDLAPGVSASHNSVFQVSLGYRF